MELLTFIIILLVVFGAAALHRGIPGLIHAARGTTPPWVEASRARMAPRDPTAALGHYGFRDVGRDVKDLGLMYLGRQLGKWKVGVADGWRKSIDDATKRLDGVAEDTPTTHDGDNDADAPWTAKPPELVEPTANGDLTEEQKKLVEAARGDWDARFAWTQEKQDLIKAGQCPWQEYDDVTTFIGSPCRDELAPGQPYCRRHGELAGYDGRAPMGAPSTAPAATEPGPAPAAPTQKETTHAPTSPPACTRSMNCTVCVLVGGVPTCISDLPQDQKPEPSQPEPSATDVAAEDKSEPKVAEPAAKSNVIPFPTIATGETDMTTATPTAPTGQSMAGAPNSETEDLPAAIGYTAGAKETCIAQAGLLEVQVGDAKRLADEARNSADGIDQAVGIATRHKVSGDAKDKLGEAKGKLLEVERIGNEVADLLARQQELYGEAAELYGESNVAFESQNNVTEAYVNNPGAGEKNFVAPGVN